MGICPFVWGPGQGNFFNDRMIEQGVGVGVSHGLIRSLLERSANTLPDPQNRGVGCVGSDWANPHHLSERGDTMDRDIALYVVQENFAVSWSAEGSLISQIGPIVVRAICVNI